MLYFKRPILLRRDCLIANTAAGSVIVRDNPSSAIHHRFQQFDLSNSTIQRTLNKGLYLQAYKIQFAEGLNPYDHRMRLDFVVWILENHYNYNDKKVIFTDDVHFHLKDMWTSKNVACRYFKPLMLIMKINASTKSHRVEWILVFWLDWLIHFWKCSWWYCYSTVNVEHNRGLINNYFWHYCRIFVAMMMLCW